MKGSPRHSKRRAGRMHTTTGLFADVVADWRERLAHVVATMREMSAHTDAQAMRNDYIVRMRRLLPLDGTVSLSRRDLSAPRFRVTRSSRWKEDINPWTERHRLPLHSGGLLAEWIYGDEPLLIDDLDVASDDPAFEYLEGFRSAAVIPMYDRGVALNMVVLLRHEPAAFAPQQFPELVWTSNLYGRATHNLVLSQQLEQAFAEVDYELKVVGDIQRSLLPDRMPEIPTMAVAAHYQTSRRAG